MGINCRLNSTSAYYKANTKTQIKHKLLNMYVYVLTVAVGSSRLDRKMAVRKCRARFWRLCSVITATFGVLD